MYLVIVESPAKSKTISKYLGSDYKIVSSFGHVRDLPSKDGSVLPEKDFEMVYQIKDRSKKAVNDIIAGAKAADCVYIASDPDREGEAIAWNIAEILKEKKVKAEIQRVSFTEITKSAVKYAIDHPREIDQDLVDAQQSRLSLDYLVGFNLSPVLWRKLPGSKSAGRVQSVALRLIVDREEEIRAFVPTEYWSVDVILETEKKEIFTARVIQYKSKKFSNSFPKDKKSAEEVIQVLKKSETLKIIDIEEKDVKRNPFAPFTTASLQQDAANKLGFSADRTMKIAQKLYEGVDLGGETKGLITYMRTDGTTIGKDAVDAIRNYISENIGGDYLSKSQRIYKTKTKNAQEAHEAIRPTDVFLSPKSIEKYLDKDEHRLYDLIWKRAVACQMSEAIFARQSIDLTTKDDEVLCRANGSILKFDGYLKIYNVILDGDEDGKLPKLKINDETKIIDPLEGKQHFTSPKPRFTEASLIKELEERGIGRPSTYAMIINIIQERGYVYIEKKQFHPESRGVVVSMFLRSFFTNYVEYDFTARIEEELDLVSDGKYKKLEFLKKFWEQFIGNINSVMGMELQAVSAGVTEAMDKYLFSGLHIEERICASCKSKNISLKVGKFGVYIACEECKANSSLEKYLGEGSGKKIEIKSESGEVSQDGLIGDDESGNKIYKKTGRYGDYVESQTQTGEMIKRASIPASFSEIDLQAASFLLSLPLKIGAKDGEDMSIGIGKYGPYILFSGKYHKIHGGEDLLKITQERAIEIIEMPRATKSESDGTKKTYEPKTKHIGDHPDTGKKIFIGKSRYGVYVLYEKKFHTAKGFNEVDEVTLEDAINLLNV